MRLEEYERADDSDGQRSLSFPFFGHLLLLSFKTLRGKCGRGQIESPWLTSAFGVSIATKIPKKVMLDAYSKKTNQYWKNCVAVEVAIPAMEKQIAQKTSVEMQRYGIWQIGQAKSRNIIFFGSSAQRVFVTILGSTIRSKLSLKTFSGREGEGKSLHMWAFSGVRKKKTTYSWAEEEGPLTSARVQDML